MENIITAIKLGAAAIGGVCGALIGKIDGVLFALLTFMTIDYITGIIVACRRHTLSSEIGFTGLAKKVFILLLVVVGNVLDVYVIGSGAVVRSAVIAFYLANEGLSILENAGNLGVPYPDKLKNVLAQLKDDSDGD
jgi:toxin secretion/phage lysis holin